MAEKPFAKVVDSYPEIDLYHYPFNAKDAKDAKDANKPWPGQLMQNIVELQKASQKLYFRGDELLKKYGFNCLNITSA